jgi:hypothetical protein
MYRFLKPMPILGNLGGLSKPPIFQPTIMKPPIYVTPIQPYQIQPPIYVTPTQPYQTQPSMAVNPSIQKPTFSPPNYKPQKPTGYMADFSFQPCLNRPTYIWLTIGTEGWYYPIMVSGNTIIGFAWDASISDWKYNPLDSKIVSTLTC